MVARELTSSRTPATSTALDTEPERSLTASDPERRRAGPDRDPYRLTSSADRDQPDYPADTVPTPDPLGSPDSVRNPAATQSWMPSRYLRTLV
jgi:hypothetical protein